jgi:hypothetical protein
MLYRSNKLMYDRGTKTLWHQFSGEPVVGPLADSGIRLELIPVALTTWFDWLALHPDTTVLDIITGVYPINSYLPEDNRGSIYFRYRNTPETIFPVPQRADALATKSQVLGLTLNGRSRAYPLESVSRLMVINDTLGGQDLVVVATDQGVGARAYQRDAHEFSLLLTGPEDGSLVLTDQNDRRWRVAEEALVLMEDPSERLPRLPSRASYWFGWYAFHPDTQVYAGSDDAPN